MRQERNHTEDMGRTNERLAIEVIERLLALGVTTFCLSAGGRNAPFVETLDALANANPLIEVLNFFDERDGAFFAIGRAKRDGVPVAVVTTSGTAVSELFSAVVEAHYSGVPLVLVTADRPVAYRGTGAPQAIEQAHLFARYAKVSFDIDRPGTKWDLSSWCLNGPVQVNVSFDEPLLKGRLGEVPSLPPLASVKTAPRISRWKPSAVCA